MPLKVNISESFAGLSLPTGPSTTASYTFRELLILMRDLPLQPHPYNHRFADHEKRFFYSGVGVRVVVTFSMENAPHLVKYWVNAANRAGLLDPSATARKRS